jgi:hypothetical protein
MLPLLNAILPVVGNVLDRIIPDKAGNEKARLEMEKALLDAATKGQLGQLEINKIEAQSSSLFKSGWRPGVAWICVAAMGFHFIVAPVVNWIGLLTGNVLPLPEFDMDALLYVLGSLLGIGALRTYEKKSGLTK